MQASSSPKLSAHVTDAVIPILRSIPAAVTSFGPLPSRRSRGTMKRAWRYL